MVKLSTTMARMELSLKERNLTSLSSPFLLLLKDMEAKKRQVNRR
jgi:hypothetical protein